MSHYLNHVIKKQISSVITVQISYKRRRRQSTKTCARAVKKFFGLSLTVLSTSHIKLSKKKKSLNPRIFNFDLQYSIEAECYI